MEQPSQQLSFIDFKRGFLPAQDPCLQLPKEFSAWEALAAALPKLLLGSELRRSLSELPEFPVPLLTEPAQLERAMLLVSFIGHAYVWGQAPLIDTVPAAIALPWHACAARLQRPPVLSYASYALHNWRRFDSHKEVALGNIALLQNFLGGVDEEWFVLVHIDIEAKAAPILQAAPVLKNALAYDDEDSLLAALQTIASALQLICVTMERMPEHCDPYIYYRRVRPYIHGWKDNPALPQGLIYEGVTEFAGKPQKFRGETGAQSSIVPLLDRLLGIAHQPDTLSRYLQEMKDYMPLSHRQFLHQFTECCVRSYVIERAQTHTQLRDAYNACVELIAHFRQIHLQYAASYIQKQSQTSDANSTATGTGGTPFMDYLRKHQDESLRHLLK